MKRRLPNPPSYSTVRALLRILEEKGHITHSEEGLKYVFRPIVPRTEAQKSAINHLLKTFFNGSVEQAMAALLDVKTNDLTAEDFERLTELIEQARRYYIRGVYFDPYQALQLSENLRRAGLWCVEVAQTHSTRGPKDTALFELASNGTLVLYDDPELRAMASAASAKELGNGQLFITKGGRGKIDLLIALSNCADEVRKMHTGSWAWFLEEV